MRDSETMDRRLMQGLRMTAIALATLVCFAGIGSVRAQAIVSDPTHMIETFVGHLTNRLETYYQRYEDKVQYARQLQHYQQQLSDVGMFFSMQRLPMTMDFRPRDEQYGMEDACGKGGFPSLAELWSRRAPDLQGDIPTQQLELCQKIVLAQNAKYNEVMRILQSIRRREQELGRADAQRAGIGSSQGRLDSSDNQYAALMAESVKDMQYAQAVLTAYDGLIASLNQDQQRLARRAMQGGDSPLGSIVQGAVLKGALHTLQQRER
jgi:hypothetical protein